MGCSAHGFLASIAMAVGLSDPVHADQDQERKAKANSGGPKKLQQLRTA